MPFVRTLDPGLTILMADGTDIGSVYQQDALRMCESFVLPNTSWASHHDVDEFLLVDAPGWSSPIPTTASSIPLSNRSTTAFATQEASGRSWYYPLHERFRDLLNRATCVPLLRLPFQNYGLHDLPLDGFITEVQTVRDKTPPNFHTYGKVSLQRRDFWFEMVPQAERPARCPDVRALWRRRGERRLDGPS